MSGYTPLFNTIVTSTIWGEDSDTRVVWVTMLAMANSRGIVEGTIPGLARLANVSIESCKAALKRFSEPDPYSRSQENEGRRIEIINGGWRILNHSHYREKARKTAEYYREYRARKNGKAQPSATACNHAQPSAIETQSTQTQTETNKNKYSPNSIELELSKLLLDKILERKEDFKKPDLQKWAVHIDRMIRLDGRKQERIKAIINFCQADNFWQNNILSTEKLRKQFDKLELEENGNNRKNRSKAAKTPGNERRKISGQDWGPDELLDPAK